jgi:hypothetical protein
MKKRLLFVVAAVALAIAGSYYRTQNAKSAQAQADQIVAQDVNGADVAASLADLKDFVGSHMGASVNLTLDGSFKRAQAVAQAAANASAINSQVYADAQRICGGKSDSITQARCNQTYVSQHLAQVPVAPPAPEPKLADYQRDFKSPVWAPDLAGALFAGAFVTMVIFGLSLITWIRRFR